MKNRKSFNLKLKKRILILCEGESEIIYLKGYRNEQKNRSSLTALEIKIYQPENYSPYGLLTEAKKRLKEAKKEHFPYDEVWIAFDKDGHENIPKTFVEAHDANIKIAFSLICFELWILLHFRQTSRPFANCDEIIKYIKDNDFPEYDKINFYLYIRMLIDTALNNAKWLHKQNKVDIDNGHHPYELNAYTNFDELINCLKKHVNVY